MPRIINSRSGLPASDASGSRAEDVPACLLACLAAVLAPLDSIQPAMRFGSLRRCFATLRRPAVHFLFVPTASRTDMKAWDASPFITFMGVNVITRGAERSEAELINRE